MLQGNRPTLGNSFIPAVIVLFLFVFITTADTYDVVVFGTTPAGVAAAYEVGRAGHNVAIYEPSDHVGGLAAGGLTNTDFKSFESLGGTWREFMDRVVEHYESEYGPESPQVEDSKLGAWYEPKVARTVFEKMLEEAGVDLYLKHELVSAATVPDDDLERITEMTTRRLPDSTLVTSQARIFIDASYEGDLAAASGNPFNLNKVLAYNFRLTMSHDPDNRISCADVKPPNYEMMDFSGLRDYLLDNPDMPLRKLVKIRSAPNSKADFNDIARRDYHFTIPGDGWCEGSYPYRAAMYRMAKTTAQGFFHFLSTDPALSDHPLQADLLEWGYAADEYTENDNFTPMLYIREGRRIIGEYKMTSADQKAEDGSDRSPAQPSAVAVADYPYSGHPNSNDYGLNVDDFFDTSAPRYNNWGEGLSDRNSGGGTAVPYSIPYGTIVPSDVNGLLVPVAVSADRTAFNAMRMEPTWTALGQAAGAAAVLALARDSAVRNIDVATLRRRLHERGAITFYVSDVPPQSIYFKAVQYLGNLGFFQNTSLIGSDRKYPAPVSLSGTQWSTARKHHDVLPDTVLTQEVEQYWRTRFSQEFGDDMLEELTVSANGTLTRGDFLLELYAIPSHPTSKSSPFHTSNQSGFARRALHYDVGSGCLRVRSQDAVHGLLRIYNVRGETVHQSRVRGHTSRPISILSKGIYIARLEGTSETRSVPSLKFSIH